VRNKYAANNCYHTVQDSRVQLLVDMLPFTTMITPHYQFSPILPCLILDGAFGGISLASDVQMTVHRDIFL